MASTKTEPPGSSQPSLSSPPPPSSSTPTSSTNNHSTAKEPTPTHVPHMCAHFLQVKEKSTSLNLWSRAWGTFISIISVHVKGEWSGILIGASLGILIVLFFSDFLGRRKTMLMALVMSVLGIIMTMVGPMSESRFIGLVLWGAGADISVIISLTIISDFVSLE